jgi:hypothetical protein
MALAGDVRLGTAVAVKAAVAAGIAAYWTMFE